jgi:pimeloyl-ACP methyl ester carboxylesterase
MANRVPLALLPGLLLDRVLWRAQIDGLADMADCRVADLTARDSVSGMAADVLAAMPGRFALAALSMGGYVALEIMRQAPERVLALALLDTTARPDSDDQTASRRGLIELAKKGKFKGVTRQLMPMLIHTDRLNEAALTGEVMAMAERIGRDAFLCQQKAIMTRPDSRLLLAQIACPTLILCGRQDALTPLAWHMEMATANPEAHLVVIEDCGHLAPLERPAEVTAAMRRWLGRV